MVLAVDNNPSLVSRAQTEWSDIDGTPVEVVPNRSAEHLARRSIHEKIHGSSRRFGAGSARNTGAERVTSDVIAFMDDDAWAQPTWLSELLRVYDNPTVRAVGGAALPYYETRRPRWFPQNFDWVFGCTYSGLPEKAAPVRHLVGSNMSVRRDAFAGVGGFYGDDFDDLNLCLRVLERYGSNSVYFTPYSVVHHYVTAERVSWRYFRRRCYFVNREKVRVFRKIGPAANLVAERQFAYRTVRHEVPRAIRAGLDGETSQFLAAGAMLIGITLAGLGNFEGQIEDPEREAVRRERSGPRPHFGGWSRLHLGEFVDHS